MSDFDGKFEVHYKESLEMIMISGLSEL